MKELILAIDQGTTGTTVCLLDAAANVLAAVTHEHPQYYPRPGWVEHDPEAIWQTVVGGIGDVLAKAKIAGERIAAIGITNQRETVVLWDRDTHAPLHNAIVWQCRRTTDYCEQLKQDSAAGIIQERTGLIIDPYFSASKFRWLLDNVKGARAMADQGRLRAGTVDAFLLWRLTGGRVHKTDISNASRTQLMNIHSGEYDPELLSLFRVPAHILPEIALSNEVFGATRGVPGLPDGIPIAGMAGDQQSALFGQACFDVGMSKCTFGTGSFMVMNTGRETVASQSGLLTTVAWHLAGDKARTYALEGGAFVCGAAVQWLRDQMQFIESSAEVEALAGQVTSSEGVFLIPAFVGLGAPYWNPHARATLLGMTRGTTRAHVARATLESMALQNADILMAMEKDLGCRTKALRVDGGAVENDLLMQMQADFLGVPVQRPKHTESTVLGAAFLAGLGVGYWPDLAALEKLWTLDREFTPRMSAADRDSHLEQWHRAVQRVL